MSEKYELGANLFFYQQRYKKKLRLQFLQDIEKMKTEGASVEDLLSHLRRHERTVRTLRSAYDEVAGNIKPSFRTILKLCDEYGLSEFKERLLLCVPESGQIITVDGSIHTIEAYKE